MNFIEGYLNEKPLIIKDERYALFILSLYPNKKEYAEKKLFVSNVNVGDYTRISGLKRHDKISVAYVKLINQKVYNHIYPNYERQFVANVNVLFKNNNEDFQMGF